MKQLLIVETSSFTTSDLSLTKDKEGNYIFEGVFGEIGVKNKNGRIYDANEYVPQIDSLQPKIRKRALLGELDHPKIFEVSLANASHIIEKLEYNPSTKLVTGKIRLLDTSKGKEAKALIDGGVPLHISSRAAGSVMENGHVKINRLFTYDLVADPGFENAELKRVNESFGIPNEDNIYIYEVDVVGESSEYINKTNNTSMEKNVSIQDFEKYTQMVKEDYDALKTKINALVNSKKNNTDDSIIKYNDKITETVNELIDVVDTLKAKLDKSIEHNDHLSENYENLKNYVKHVAEVSDKGIEYTKHVAEVSDNGIEYTKNLAKNLDESMSKIEAINESLEKNIAYINYISENFDVNIDLTNALVKNQNELISVTEGLKTYSSMIASNVTSLNKYQDHVKESYDSLEDSIKNINENKVTVVQENVQVSNPQPIVIDSVLNERVNELIETAKKKKAENESSDKHFLKFIDPSKKNAFESLTEAKKEEVIETFKKSKYFSTTEANAIYESVFLPKVEKIDFIVNMPDEYKESWNNLTESQQYVIKTEATRYPLNTQYQITNFWQTRDLRSRKVVFEKVNESATLVVESNSIVSQDKLDFYAQEFKKRFEK
jgi:hypothetical protein